MDGRKNRRRHVISIIGDLDGMGDDMRVLLWVHVVGLGVFSILPILKVEDEE